MPTNKNRFKDSSQTPERIGFRNLGDIHQFVHRETGTCAKQMDFMRLIFPPAIIGVSDQRNAQADSTYKWWDNSVQRTNAFKGLIPNRWRQKFTNLILEDFSVYHCLYEGYLSLMSEVDATALYEHVCQDLYTPERYPSYVNDFLKTAGSEEILTVLTICALICYNDKQDNDGIRALPEGFSHVLLKRMEEQVMVLSEVAEALYRSDYAGNIGSIEQGDGNPCNVDFINRVMECIKGIYDSSEMVDANSESEVDCENAIRRYSEVLQLWKEGGGRQFALNLSKTIYKEGLLAINGLDMKTPDGINYGLSFRCFQKADALVMGNRRDFPLPACQLAHLYYTGKGGEEGNEHDYQKAFRYARCAADAGSAEGQALLSMMYRMGVGCEKDFDKAIQHARIAFSNGNNSQCYMIAREAERNHQYEDVAIEFYSYIKEIHSAAAYRLGLIYKDRSEDDLALQHLYLAVNRKKPNVNALTALGQIHFTGIRGQVSFISAYNFFEQAAEYEDTQAIYMLGYMELYGLGCVPDCEKAEKHFLIASQRGYILATKELFKLYMNKGDIQKALEIVEISEDSGGQMNLLLGIAYERGIAGVEANQETAKRFFFRAKERKNEDAFLFL